MNTNKHKKQFEFPLIHPVTGETEYVSYEGLKRYIAEGSALDYEVEAFEQLKTIFEPVFPHFSIYA